MRYLFLLYLFLITITADFLFAQSPVRLEVLPADSAATSYKFRSGFENLGQIKKYMADLPQSLLSQGYLGASIDSVALDSPFASIKIYLGKRYKWSRVWVDEAFMPLAQELQLPGNKKNQSGYFSTETDFRQKTLDYLQEQGYPFAQVWFDSVAISDNLLSAKLVIDKGNAYKIDSIAQKGTLRLKPSFIYRYLNLTPGSLYKNSGLQQISKRLDELPFAKQVQPWSMDMLGTGGVVNIFLEQKRSNILNALIGVMPSSTQTPDNKLMVTGDVNILLRNSFRSGEELGVNWQQIQYKSPRLNLFYKQPYLFGSGAGADFFFELFKKDTQWVNLQVRLGMPYDFSGGRSGEVFFHYQQTSIITPDTGFVLKTGQLPPLAATSSLSLGIGYEKNTTDYSLNPRRGSELNIRMRGGTKKIAPSSEIQNLKNPADPDFSYGSLYDSLEMNTYQYRIRVQWAGYFPAGRVSVFKIGLDVATYESGNFFRNELYQIGGYRLLRGFDEESIFARRYGVMTTEYRLLSGKNAYFFGFFDAGYVQYKDQVTKTGRGYFGSGLGLMLETKNSMINLSWAVGKRDDQALDFKQSKIHLGLINFF